MYYSISDYIFSLFITSAVYCLIPIIIAWKFRNLKLWIIRTISIVNYIIGVAFFYYINGDSSAGAAFLWSCVGYHLMKHYSLKNSATPASNCLDESFDATNIPIESSEAPLKETIASSLTETIQKKKFKGIYLVVTILLLYSFGITVCVFNITHTSNNLSTELELLQSKYEILQDNYDSLYEEYGILESSYYKTRDYLSVIIYLYSVEGAKDFVTPFDRHVKNEYAPKEYIFGQP